MDHLVFASLPSQILHLLDLEKKSCLQAVSGPKKLINYTERYDLFVIACEIVYCAPQL